LLEPGFAAGAAATRIGRIRPAGHDADPVIEAAVDEALARSELEVVEIELSGWQDARDACTAILDVEAMESNRVLLASQVTRDLLGSDVCARLEEGKDVSPGHLAEARAFRSRWQEALLTAMREVDALALPTVRFFAPPLTEVRPGYTELTNPVNLAGFPALALPVPAAGPLPASLQLIGAPDSEDMLLATGAILEASAGYLT
jgi:amidase